MLDAQVIIDFLPLSNAFDDEHSSSIIYTQTTNPSKYEIFHRCPFSLPRIGIGCQRMDAGETQIDREFNLMNVVIVDYDVVN